MAFHSFALVIAWGFYVCHQPAHAQILDLRKTPIPEVGSLDMLYSFYVYSREDAPNKQFGDAYVRFHEVESHPAPDAHETAESYSGLQLSLVLYDRFWDLVDARHFCCTAFDVEMGVCNKRGTMLFQKKEGQENKDVGALVQDIPFEFGADPSPLQTKIRMRLSHTGVYILMFSNCGEKTPRGTVTGQVSVRNPYGFLPGTEYHKLRFFGWLTVLYMGLGLVWMGLSLYWWREMSTFQVCIGGVVFLGFLECFMSFTFFSDWNSDGVHNLTIFVVNVLASVTKSVFSYMLVLVAALGWGVTRPYLDSNTSWRIQMVSALYIILGVVKQTVLAFRHSHSLPTTFILLCLLPASLLNGFIFYWVFSALSSLMATLKERRQMERLVLFERLWSVLILSMFVATGSVLYQIFSLSTDISTRWMHKWLFTDGVFDLLFLAVLMTMMYLWSPHKLSQKYAYSVHVDGPQEQGGEDRARGGTDWYPEEEIDEEEEDIFGGLGMQSPKAHDGPMAATIGSSSSTGMTGTSVLQDAIADLERIGMEEPIQGKVE